MEQLAPPLPEAAIPLHLRTDPGLAGEQVSRRSKWGDKAWQFDNPTPSAHPSSSRVSWDVALADGSTLCDPQHGKILDWMRRLVWSLKEAPADNSTPLAPGGASILSTGLRRFAGWLVENAYTLPHELDEAALRTFKDDLPGLLADDADDEADITDSQAIIHLRIPLLLWQQRHELAAAGIKPLPTEPWSGRAALDLAQEIATVARGWIKPLPDEVALPTLNTAATFLTVPARDIIELHSRFWAIRDQFTGRLTQSHIQKKQRALLKNFRFSVDPNTGRPWHPSLAEARDSTGKDAPAHRLRQLVLAVRDAASIVILSASGVRVSELCGLEKGIDPSTGLPHCVRIETSFSSLNELFIMTSLLSKGEETPREADWLLGARPVGEAEVPPAVQAILLLNELFAPYRGMAKSARLFIQFSNNRGLPLERAQGALGSHILAGIRNFIEAWVDLSHLPDQSAHPVEENDLIKYRESKGRCVRTHQFRKSFANFTLSVSPSLLPALQRHFHHVSQAVTEGGYWGRNPLQVEPLSTMQRQQTNMLVYEMATGRSVATGRMGDHVADHIAELRSLIEGQSISEGWKTTAQFVNDYDLRLWFAPHGKCLPLIPIEMRCHDLAGTSSWLNREPNYETREPSVCAGCSCFILDARHRSFWEQRYVQNWLAYRQAEARGNEGQFRLMRERGSQAGVLLRRIGASTDLLDSQIKEELSCAA